MRKLEIFAVQDDYILCELGEWAWLLHSHDTTESLLYPFGFYLEKITVELTSALLAINHDINKYNLRTIIVRDIKESVSKIVKRVIVWEYTLTNRKTKGRILFLDFIEKLINPKELGILFKKYPVMKEILFNLFNNYLSSQLEFINRLSKDSMEVKKLTGLSRLKLMDFEQVGDSHCKGRKTVLLTFYGKQKNIHIIYKPRPIELDKKFQEYLEFVNNFFHKEFLKIIPMIDKGNYGWIQFVEHKAIKKNFENEFYYQLGVLLGVVYSLNGHDFHFENVIAHGQQPILIDLECLFAIPINERQYNNSFWPEVHETSIIPNIGKNQGINYDFSSLLFHDNQISPNDRFEMKWLNNYSVKIERKPSQIKPAKNNPFYDDNTNINLLPLLYKKDIVKGFRDYYLCLLDNKKEFYSLIVSKFSASVKRIIFRSTFIYDKLMSESYHPRLLADRDEYINFLSHLNVNLYSEIYKDIFSAEIDDLLNVDIPCFFSKISVRDVYASDGIFFHYPYPQNAMERVLNKFNLLSNKNLTNQCRLILKSLKENYAG